MLADSDDDRGADGVDFVQLITLPDFTEAAAPDQCRTGNVECGLPKEQLLPLQRTNAPARP
jgi:hypothetical protein